MTAAGIRRRLVTGGAALIVGAAPAALAAQEPPRAGLSATVDAGGSRVHYDGYLPSAVFEISPTLRLDAPDAVLLARGSVARFESGNMNTQGTLSAGAFSAPWGPLRGELTADATLGHHESIGTTGRARLTARLHVQSVGQGGWAGAASGWSALGGGMGAAITELEAGGWLRRPVGPGGWLRATVGLRSVRVDGLTYSDAEGALRWTSDRAELGIDAGLRGGDRALGGGHGRSWLAADVALWVTPRAALVAAAGRFLPDPTTSAIGGRHATLGLRLALRRPPRDELPRIILPRARADGERDAGGVGPGAAAGSLVVEEVDGGRVTLRFTLPGAGRAELMGDFTGWEPLPLRRDADGRWSATLALAPGVHRVNLRTDGGAWRAPPGLTAVDDGFGGEVGLLVVGR